MILLENKEAVCGRGGQRGGLDGNAVLNQHRVQVVVWKGEALITLADVVGDLVEVLTKSLHTPPRGLLHKMDVWEVAKRPLQDREPDAGTEPSHPLNPLCCLSLPAPCPRHPSTILATTPLPRRKSPRTLSSGSRQRVHSTKSTMHVVFTSGKVSMYVCRVVSPLVCIGGFLMDEGKLGIQEVNSS